MGREKRRKITLKCHETAYEARGAFLGVYAITSLCTLSFIAYNESYEVISRHTLKKSSHIQRKPQGFILGVVLCYNEIATVALGDALHQSG